MRLRLIGLVAAILFACGSGEHVINGQRVTAVELAHSFGGAPAGCYGDPYSQTINFVASTLVTKTCVVDGDAGIDGSLGQPTPFHFNEVKRTLSADQVAQLRIVLGHVTWTQSTLNADGYDGSTYAITITTANESLVLSPELIGSADKRMVTGFSELKAALDAL